ncbi:hypothetical protein [Amorphus orientalis]|uniref:Uncharacterized protein n=1 Tax=Amorphus orientalis TaxID=649198 RepID=A0AAE3VSX7_9HYPH|nr:hypothetical protein [Amorphus orientalis]MDQ0317536.1 hypothetical protein [Amorphus orientalis]
MSGHAYKVGQTVSVSARHLLHGNSGDYTILALMPEEHGDYQYRVKSGSSPQQRVIRESEINRATTRTDVFRQQAG